MESNCIKENGVVGSDGCVKEKIVANTDTKKMDDGVSGEVEIIDNDSDVKCHEEEEEEDAHCGEPCIYGYRDCPSKRHRREYEAWRSARMK